jgi:hypothetical protein
LTCEQLAVRNPKRTSVSSLGRDQWFPFYAGFSSEFANHLIANSELPARATVMDPWNGAGTTTSSAVLNGYKALGFDLNPVMAVVAKAKLLQVRDLDSIAVLCDEILDRAKVDKSRATEDDPLLTWFAPDAATVVRRIERAIYTLTVSANDMGLAVHSAADFSSLGAFLYLALFRVVRSLLGCFLRSNPTWISRPKNSRLEVVRAQPGVAVLPHVVPRSCATTATATTFRSGM